MQISDLTRRNFSPPKFDIYDYVQITHIQWNWFIIIICLSKKAFKQMMMSDRSMVGGDPVLVDDIIKDFWLAD